MDEDTKRGRKLLRLVHHTAFFFLDDPKKGFCSLFFGGMNGPELFH